MAISSEPTRTHRVSINVCTARTETIWSILLVVVTGIAAPTFAQGGAYATHIDEVIVISQRREQNMQDVGASISTMSGSRFQELSMRTVTDLTEQIPNLTFATPAGEATNLALSIRGVGLNDLSDSNEGPVAIYVDEVYLGTLTAQAGQLFDLERIEVVRGPQGTLYGRNTTGGLVHFVTNSPTEEIDVQAEVSVGNDSRIKLESALSGPLTSSLFGRLSILHDSDDGYQTDRTSNNTFGTKDIFAIRGQLLAALTENLEIKLTAYAGTVDNRPTLYKPRGLLETSGQRCSDTEIVKRQCFDGFGYRDPVDNPDSVELHPDVLGPRQEIDSYGGNIKASWESGALTITSITASSSLDKEHWDGSFANPNDLFQSGQFLEARQFTQELRAGIASDRADYVLGLFYFGDNKKGSIPFNSPFDYDTRFDQDTDAYAAFAHAQWQFATDWSLAAGARYSRELKKLDFRVLPGTIAGAGLTFDDDLDTDNLSWNIGLNWHFAEHSLLFANMAHGFKSGGWNAGGFVVIVDQIRPFDDETVDTVELGLKTMLLNGRLRLNATGFYYDYRDMQAFTQADVNGLPLSALTNAGSADIYGVETELLWQANDALEVSLGLGWLETETKEFFSFEGLTPGGEPIIEDLSGSELVLAPRITANGLVRYVTEFMSGEFTAQIDFSYSDSYFFDTDNAPLDVAGSALLWNGRLGWQLPDSKIELALFGRNLTDERKIIEGFDIFDTQMLIYNHARVYGISVTYRH